jgi:ComF family protein
MLNFLKQFVAWALPHVCIFCKTISDRKQDLCQACLRELPILSAGCIRCAIPLSAAEHALQCGQCLQHTPPFDRTHALFLYQPPITKLILDLKFQQALIHARLLGELLAEKILHDWYQTKSLPSAIIPVPLHRERLKERGFNQALEIARPIAKALHLPMLVHGFIRKKHTIAQAKLPANQRRQNIRGAFVIEHDLKDQHVAVLDDVITTGNTIHEFCQMLKKQGARKIDVWCCARPISLVSYLSNTRPAPFPFASNQAELTV